jgi:hypothetical protein
MTRANAFEYCRRAGCSVHRSQENRETLFDLENAISSLRLDNDKWLTRDQGLGRSLAGFSTLLKRSLVSSGSGRGQL